MGMEHLDEEEIRAELTRITRVLEEITGLTSRWNGTVEFTFDPPEGYRRAHGRKPFSCGIKIDHDLAQTPARWRTLIHEALHALSEGYTRDDYLRFRGWEEGVVEKTQRLVRRQVLERLGVDVSEEIFAPFESPHIFDPQIEALEAIRAALGRDALAFYLALLSTPIRFRPGALYGESYRLEPDARKAYLIVFSRASAALGGEG